MQHGRRGHDHMVSEDGFADAIDANVPAARSPPGPAQAASEPRRPLRRGLGKASLAVHVGLGLDAGLLGSKALCGIAHRAPRRVSVHLGCAQKDWRGYMYQ